MNKLKVSEEFVVGKHNIGYINSDFTNAFKTEEFVAGGMPTFRKLDRSMNDAEIESELKPGICTLADVLAFIDIAPQECKDGWANLFYFPAFVVRVRWRSGGWFIYAWGRDDGRWGAGHRVFSPATVRSSSCTLSNSLTLRPSKTITVDRVDRVTISINESPIELSGEEARELMKNLQRVLSK